MGNEGIFELGLLDVENRPARDPKVTVDIFRASDRRIIRVETFPSEWRNMQTDIQTYKHTDIQTSFKREVRYLLNKVLLSGVE